jgi:Fe-S-cluster containining protein
VLQYHRRIWFPKAMTGIPHKKPVCSNCGRCCKEEGSGFTMMPSDYRRWKRQGRHDILRYVSQYEGHADYGDIWVDWIDPETGEVLGHCPFLHKVHREKYTCAIHHTKPTICKRFWCEWAYGIGKKGVPFRRMAGWTGKAKHN